MRMMMNWNRTCAASSNFVYVPHLLHISKSNQGIDAPNNNLSTFSFSSYIINRVQWLSCSCGDHNTAYFQRVGQSNASRKAIRRLTTASGEVLTKGEDIKAEAAKHFREFLQI